MQRTKTGIFDNEASAAGFDGVTTITKDQFCTMLDKTLPRDACAPFDLGLIRDPEPAGPGHGEF